MVTTIKPSEDPMGVAPVIKLDVPDAKLGWPAPKAKLKRPKGGIKRKVKAKVTKAAKSVKSFIIDRRKWFRGKGGEDSQLLKTNGKMCCVGIYGKALGVPRKYLFDIATVTSSDFAAREGDVPVKLPWPKWTVPPTDSNVAYPQQVIDMLYAVNDYRITGFNSTDIKDQWGDKLKSEADREKWIAKLFKRKGVKVKFTN